jgi:rhodanese-related sulfurtransferase
LGQQNNIPVVIETTNDVRSACIGIWVKAGARNEAVEKNGISHFLEHMFFKGTNSLTSKDIAMEIDSIGGELNAFTSCENTTFYIKNNLDKQNPVLVHCAKGHHRSAAVVVAFLIRYKNWDFVKAYEYINKLRPYALRRDTCMSKNVFMYYLHLNNKKCDFECKQHGSVHYCECKNSVT